MDFKNTCIIVDSSSGIKNNEIKNVFMEPLEIIETTSDNKEIFYKDNIDIDSKMIIEKIKHNIDLKTSQTPIGIKTELIERLLKTYTTIFVIPISSGISGAFQSWQMVRNEIGNKNVHILDVEDICVGTQNIVSDILDMISKNKTVNDVLEYVENRKKRRFGVLIVNDISQLKKGGRISGFKAMIVKALKMNLLINFDGKLTYFDKEISETKAIDKAYEKINNEIDFKSKGIKRIFMYTTYLDESINKTLADKISQKIGMPIKYYVFPPSIAIHTGFGTFALFVESN
ncbi:MAG: DegV family protein [Malacoplasma sp.]